MKTIVLTGMMGCGKTTVGELLAKKLGLEFFDLDKLIEIDQKCSISEIFFLRGQKFFRELEEKIIMSKFNSQNIVIALGGGTFENPSVRNFLLKNSIVICLDLSAEKIFERLKDDKSRPLLASEMSVEKIHSIKTQRQENYDLAHYKILVADKNCDMICEEILGVLKND